jgi:hypothetical protein
VANTTKLVTQEEIQRLLSAKRLAGDVTTQAQRVFELVIRTIVGVFDGLVTQPDTELLNRAPLGVSELLLGACLQLDTSSAYRGLLATGVQGIAERCESFQWDRYRYLQDMFAQVSVTNVLAGKSYQELLQLVDSHKEGSLAALRTFMIDARDYAEWACNDSPGRGSETEPPSQTRHLLLSALSDCACCPPKPTRAALSLAGAEAVDTYWNLRYQKSFPDRLEYTERLALAVEYAEGEFIVSLRAKSADFSRYNLKGVEHASNSTLFRECRPPLFLESELSEFREIVNENYTKRERHLQQFIENRSHFLRALGISSFAPQVHLKPVGPTVAAYDTLASLCVDFLGVNVGDGTSTIVELKRGLERTVVGLGSRRRASYQLNEALVQLEDYYRFFEDSANRHWFAEKYGKEIFRPQLLLLIGNSSLSKSGLPTILSSPHENVPVRVVSYEDVLNVIRCQHLVLPTKNWDLE